MHFALSQKMDSAVRHFPVWRISQWVHPQEKHS
jgi:hypothetical protein